MDFPKLLASLERFGQMLPEVVRGVSDDDARWKPADGAWSVLEIVAHLVDEEKFDFGTRMRLVMTDPTKPWPAIDPEGWAVERRYNDGDLQSSVQEFVRLRAESVDWLRQLENPDWQQAYDHPRFGPFRAGDLLSSWVAHDHLHLRQIAKRLYQLGVRDAGEFSTRYAGEW